MSSAWFWDRVNCRGATDNRRRTGETAVLIPTARGTYHTCHYGCRPQILFLGGGGSSTSGDLCLGGIDFASSPGIVLFDVDAWQMSTINGPPYPLHVGHGRIQCSLSGIESFMQWSRPLQ
jgi:hypothetical protein